jgi:hypothetical protein
MRNYAHWTALQRDRHIDDLIDEAGRQSFPASDPPAVTVPWEQPENASGGPSAQGTMPPGPSDAGSSVTRSFEQQLIAGLRPGQRPRH